MDRTQQVLILKLEHVESRNKLQFRHLLARIKNLEDSQKHSKKRAADLTASELKQEVRSLASLRGHSRLLATSSPTAKTAALLLGLVLLASCAFLVASIVRDYLSFSVLTVEQRTAVGPSLPKAPFPAITVCPLSRDSTEAVVSIPLEHTLAACLLDSWPHRCRAEDFQSLAIWSPLHDQHLACYKWNGGHDQRANSSRRPLYSTANSGHHSGLTLAFRLPTSGWVLSFVGDTHVRPSFRELASDAKPGSMTATAVHRHVTERLGRPYSDCVGDADTSRHESSFVAEFAFRNQTYRQINCLELCHESDRDESSVATKRGNSSAVFDECSRLCPMECLSVDYAVDRTQVRVGERHLAWMLARRERFSMSANLLANSSLHDETALALSSFYLDKMQVTLSRQLPKESAYSLLAKIGGLLCLFLEFNLMTVYRIFF